MRLLVLTAMAAGGCFSTPPYASDGGAIPSTAHRRTITIQKTPSSELALFPVAVTLEDDSSLTQYAASERNIAFVSSSGAVLPCEIVAYSSGSLEAWVQMPVLSATQRTVDLIYGPDVASTCASAAMWPSAEYRAVWHLADKDPTRAQDATANQQTLLGAANASPTSSPGLLGASFRFDNHDSNGADQVCSASGALDFGAESFTYGLWVKQDMYNNDFDVPLTNGGKAVTQPGYDIELGAAQWSAYVRDDTDPPNVVLFANDSTPFLGSWHHLAVTLDRGTSEVTSYLDGAATQQQPVVVTAVKGPDSFCLGDTTEPMVGNIDEVRLENVARSPDWLLTTYLNLLDPGTFLQVGPDH